LVLGAGPRTGDFHGDLDSLHFLLWNLLQVGRIDGETTVTDIDLLVTGIFVFTLVVIGLGLTVMEFRKMK
jgi:hypothetical protein